MSPVTRRPDKRKPRQIGPTGVVKYCRRGGRLTKSLATKGRVEFRLEPDGIRVQENQALQAIFSGDLIQESDGFFGVAQSWGAKAVTTVKPTKYERLHYLLGAFGDDLIDRDTFWKMMAEQNLTDADIDGYCDGTISPDCPNGK